MFLELNFRSKQLNKNTQVNILIPDQTEAPYKTLWLLHGLSGDHTSWMRNTSIERYANEHGIAVIMPNGDRSWYTNNTYGVNYFNYIAEELPMLCRGLFKGMSDKREDQIIAGISMGGYGAVKLALTCPEKYGSCISLSGSLDVTRKGRTYNLEEWKSIFKMDMTSASELEGGEHDLFALATKHKAQNKAFPRLYMWCGTEDSLLGINKGFDAHLWELSYPHLFEFSEGNHSWKWWDLHIQGALNYVLKDS